MVHAATVCDDTAAMKDKHTKATRRWRITLIRAKGSPVGTIEAATAEEAAELFGITGEQRKRLIAQPVE
jgi:hypothetical protein